MCDDGLLDRWGDSMPNRVAEPRTCSQYSSTRCRRETNRGWIDDGKRRTYRSEVLDDYRSCSDPLPFFLPSSSFVSALWRFPLQSSSWSCCWEVYLTWILLCLLWRSCYGNFLLFGVDEILSNSILFWRLQGGVLRVDRRGDGFVDWRLFAGFFGCGESSVERVRKMVAAGWRSWFSVRSRVKGVMEGCEEVKMKWSWRSEGEGEVKLIVMVEMMEIEMRLKEKEKEVGAETCWRRWGEYL